jgi:menaquinone-dependent protoporphyrinogen oxidase
MVADAFTQAGMEAVVRPGIEARSVDGYDAVVVGGALYANRWHRDARHFVKRETHGLLERPVWFFSSGPLDESARDDGIEPTRQVAKLMARVGTRGHMTFGGRLEPTAKGFPAKSMAKTRSGDWRDPQQVAEWVDTIVAELRPPMRMTA